MSDELRESFSQVQQGDSGEVETAEGQKFDSSLKVTPESQSKDEKSPGPKEPEEITALKDRVQELNEIVELEKSRSDLILKEAKLALKQALNAPQEEREVLEARVKILEEHPVLKAFESELKKSKKAWQKQIASPNKSESVKPGVAQLSKEFEELKARYDEMFQVNRGDNDSEQKKGAVLKFDESSAEFKKDFLKADLKDQKKTLAKAAEISRLDKMSAGFKKGLQMEISQESVNSSKQFSVQVQEIQKQIREERLQKHEVKRDSSDLVEKNNLQKKSNLGKIREALKAFGAGKSIAKIVPRVRKQDSSLGR